MELPLIIEPTALNDLLKQSDLCIIDLGKAQTYATAHIPGAVYLPYAEIVRSNRPIMGLLPSVDELTTLLRQLGVNNDTTIVAYDDEGGGCASRLLWTLDYLGCQHMSLLNGGIHAWLDEGLPVQSEEHKVSTRGNFTPTLHPQVVADRNYILNHLHEKSISLLDARSAEEFDGRKKFSARGGHIPGAVNLDWLLLMDQNRKLRLKRSEELRLMLGSLDVTAHKEVIVYCQSHHRSALSYVALKSLGYEKLRGYPGSWSDWGNSEDTPVEV